MKLFIIDDNTEAEIFIYGIDGSDCTERFFVSFFDGKGIKRLTEEEKNRISHRGKALRLMKEELRKR